MVFRTEKLSQIHIWLVFAANLYSVNLVLSFCRDTGAVEVLRKQVGASS